MLRHIDRRTNPEYKYDIVIDDINYNFGLLSGSTSDIFLSLSGGTVTGNTIFTSGLSATTFSAGTYYSGSTPLETIIANLAGGGGASTYVQPGLNTYTGGTASAPTVNISSATLSDLTVSGNTIIDIINASGSSNYFSQAVNGNSTTLFSEGVITIASDNSYVNITGDYLITNNFIANNNLSGGTIYSGSTPLETIITNIANALEQNDITRVQPGLNTYTGGTTNAPTVNISAATLSYLSATTVSASTLYSGSTSLETVVANIALGYSGTSGNLWSSSTGVFSIISNNNQNNVASGGYSIAIGKFNTAGTGTLTSVLGGVNNSSSGSYSVVAGGFLGQANGQYGFIGNGYNNIISSGQKSFIGNGYNNVISNQYSSILNGITNRVSGSFSTILGGQNNVVSGTNSSILAGQNLTLLENNTALAANLSAGTISGGTYYSGNTNLETLFDDRRNSAFRIYKSNTQNFTAATFTNVTFNNTVYDYLTEFDGTYFTASTSGVYMFSSGISYQPTAATATLITISLYINDVESQRLNQLTLTSTNNIVIGGTTNILLNSGDRASIVFRGLNQGGSFTITTSGLTWFSGCKLL